VAVIWGITLGAMGGGSAGGGGAGLGMMVGRLCVLLSVGWVVVMVIKGFGRQWLEEVLLLGGWQWGRAMGICGCMHLVLCVSYCEGLCCGGDCGGWCW